MDFATLVFWIIAVILVGSALAVVMFRNIVHSALALVLTFAMAAGIYILLNAERVTNMLARLHTARLLAREAQHDSERMRFARRYMIAAEAAIAGCARLVRSGDRSALQVTPLA